MKIGKIIRYDNINTYRKLKAIDKKKKSIRLGDKPENLIRANSHKRCERRIRQIKWG